MNKIRELFGLYCGGNADISSVVHAKTCPFTHRKCYKTRKSEPDTAIGTCTVNYQNTDIIICPNRMLENNQVFFDCLHLLSLHEPGNELYIVPEVTIPGGVVDYFLVSAKNQKVMDFIGIEFQTMDTTGTVWPERQQLLAAHGLGDYTPNAHKAKSFGINWKMTAKTILLQMHHKAEMFERLNKHIVLIIQKPFLDYMNRAFSFTHIDCVRLGDPVHIHAYNAQDDGERLRLALDSRLSTDSQGIAKCLGLNAQPRLELDDIYNMLESKLSNECRLHFVG